MRSFIESFKFPLLTLVILIGVTTGAYHMLSPTGADISNSEIIRIFKMAGWFTGLATALLSIILLGILNLIRRIIRLRQVFLLHAPTVLLSVLPWLVFSWQVTAEPRYTNIAMAIIDFVGRPLLWGSLAATVFSLLFTCLAFFTKKK